MSHHNNSNIFSVILFSFFSFLFFTAFIFFFIIRYSYNFINKYYSVFCIHKIFGIQKFFVNKYYSVLVIRKFFIKEDIWSSVFGNFSWTKIFDLRSSEIFHERRSSVFGIRKFLKNEDLRSSVFGNFSWTKIFGLRYSVKITLRCNSGWGPEGIFIISFIILKSFYYTTSRLWIPMNIRSHTFSHPRSWTINRNVWIKNENNICSDA